MLYIHRYLVINGSYTIYIIMDFFTYLIFFLYVWYSQMLDNTFFLPYSSIVIFNPYFNLSIIARMRTENINIWKRHFCVCVFCWITFSKKVIHRWLKWTPIKVTVVFLKSSLLVWLSFFFTTVFYIRRYLWMVTKTNYVISSLISISWTIYKLILLTFCCEMMTSEVI